MVAIICALKDLFQTVQQGSSMSLKFPTIYAPIKDAEG
jgi:hypothetical protein